ncbi:MAG: 30S ribosomal protein S2, partial [Candidatus Omnitrophica bacterium]|nr:30S ribosomal protein S2 [Candidatus Omnitrophota bacterium]
MKLQDNLIKQFLEAGVHFGHQAKRWNPKMRGFVFGEKGGVHIIDLQKTSKRLEEARNFLRETALRGGGILFVGTKKQAQDIVEQETKRCSMYYINYRWLGGTLTNFETIRKSVAKMKSLRHKREQAEAEKMTKKEIAELNKELEKLERNLLGIEEMQEIPQAIFVIDAKREEIAIKEANKLNIPVVAVVDTNCDPDDIDYPIPANDDAIRAIKLITGLVTDSILEGREEFIKGPKIIKKAEPAVEEKKVEIKVPVGEELDEEKIAIDEIVIDKIVEEDVPKKKDK